MEGKEEWRVNRKADAMLQTAGLFCRTEGLLLIECDLISNTELPSSPFGAAVTRCLARTRQKTACHTDSESGLLKDPGFRQMAQTQPSESFPGAVRAA